jgi:hypothetical protein
MTLLKSGLVGFYEPSRWGWILAIFVFLIATAVIVWICSRIIARESQTPGLTIHELSAMMMGTHTFNNPTRAMWSFVIIGGVWFTIYWGSGWWLLWVLLVLYLGVFGYITGMLADR